MLQDIRQNIQGTAAKIVVGLIVVSFSIFGIESILVGGGGGGVAEVNGEEISPQELQQSVNTQKRRLIAMMGDNIDPAMLDDERLGAQALEALIGRKLLMQSAQGMKLAVSEQQIGLLVAGMEEFKVDGTFSPELYKSVLSNAGYTPASFKQTLREDMLLNHLRSGLAGSDFATPAELELNARISAEQRDLRYLTIPRQAFAVKGDIEPAEIEAYYAENQADFQTAEAVDVEYIELAADDFQQPVEESALLEAYELEKENYQYQTENRVSHILFEGDADGASSAVQERIAQAQAQLAAGTDFADVAREFSDDVGSANGGGDLGFSSGDAFPQEMEEAIARLEPGVVSEPVQTEAGAHLILVTERREGKMPPFEEMRAQLQNTLQADEARVVLLRTVETLRDLSFNAEDLSGPADELELTISRLDGVTRSHLEGLFAHPSLLAAAFSEEVLEAGHNSEVIELGSNKFVVLRVRSHHLPQVKALDTVRDEISGIISDQNTRVAVATEAERALLALRSGTGVEKFATSHDYEWQVELGADRRNRVVPAGVLQRVFQLPAPVQGETSSDYVMTAGGDALVFELTRVTLGEYEALASAERQVLQQQVSSEYGSLLDSEFQRGLRDSADITAF